MRSCALCNAAIKRSISIGFVFSYQSTEESVACENCLKKFDRLENHPSCPGCNRKQGEKKMCTDCVKWEAQVTAFKPNHQALFVYNAMARQFMNQYKFQGDIVLGGIFKDTLASHFKKASKTHAIVPIPLSQKGKETRGFNQVEALLRQAGVPFEEWLIHAGDGEKQSSKTKEERMQTKQPFQLAAQKGRAGEKTFLIVDDVYTTGRTLYHARSLLETFGKTETFSLFR